MSCPCRHHEWQCRDSGRPKTWWIGIRFVTQSASESYAPKCVKSTGDNSYSSFSNQLRGHLLQRALPDFPPNPQPAASTVRELGKTPTMTVPVTFTSTSRPWVCLFRSLWSAAVNLVFISVSPRVASWQLSLGKKCITPGNPLPTLQPLLFLPLEPLL